MITFEEYFGPWLNHPDATDERKANARTLLDKVSMLEAYAVADGIVFPDHEHSGTGMHNAKYDSDDEVSGKTYGGFRPQDCPQGAPHSSHKEGMAVDRYDPDGQIDEWCMANQDEMAACGIYIEHPDTTPGWCHQTIRAPASGHRVFYP